MSALVAKRRGWGKTLKEALRDPVGTGDASRRVSIADLDQALRGPLEDSAVLDLSRVKFLEHQTLLYIVGFLLGRFREGSATTLRLPESDDVVRYLANWRLPDAVAAFHPQAPPFSAWIHDTPGSTKLDPDYSDSTHDYVTVDDNGEPQVLISLDKFRISPISHLSAATLAASTEQDRFNDDYMRAVFRQFIGGAGYEYGTVLAYELVKNAVLHGRQLEHSAKGPRLAKDDPGSVWDRLPVAFISSQFTRPSKTSPSNEFVMSIWDNGPGVEATLRRRIDAGRSIFTDDFGRSTPNPPLDVREHSSGSTRKVRILPSPEFAASASRLPKFPSAELVALAFLKGVTSLPASERDPIDGDTDHAGEGLWNVVKFVCLRLGGTISYVSGTTRLRLTRGPESLICDVWREAWRPHIRGNLVFATMPVADRKPVGQY